MANGVNVTSGSEINFMLFVQERVSLCYLAGKNHQHQKYGKHKGSVTRTMYQESLLNGSCELQHNVVTLLKSHYQLMQRLADRLDL